MLPESHEKTVLPRATCLLMPAWGAVSTVYGKTSQRSRPSQLACQQVHSSAKADDSKRSRTQPSQHCRQRQQQTRKQAPERTENSNPIPRPQTGDSLGLGGRKTLGDFFQVGGSRRWKGVVEGFHHPLQSPAFVTNMAGVMFKVDGCVLRSKKDKTARAQHNAVVNHIKRDPNAQPSCLSRLRAH